MEALCQGGGLPLLERVSSALAMFLCVSRSPKLLCGRLHVEANWRDIQVVIQR